MRPENGDNWIAANQRYLTAAVSAVRAHLDRYAGSGKADPVDAPAAEMVSDADSGSWEPAARGLPALFALETLCGAFCLSAFERDVLLLCAGVELNSGFASLIATLQGDPLRTYPTFSLALAALPAAHWNALSPASPLRRWRMIEVAPGNVLTLCPLKIDERILHYLTGIQYLDERLVGIVEKIQTIGVLTPSQKAIGERIAVLCSQARDGSPLPVIQISGQDPGVMRDIAALACSALGIQLWMMHARNIPSSPSDLERYMRLWEREAFLTGSALLIDFHAYDPPDAAIDIAFKSLSENIDGVLIVAGPERKKIKYRLSVYIDVPEPRMSEQRLVWLSVLGEDAASLDGSLEPFISQFRLSPSAIQASCAEARERAAAQKADFGAALWDACRIQARPQIEKLTERIAPMAGWEDLVLPEAQMEILKEIAMHVRRRSRVYDDWGFSGKSARGLGISALFAGPSGTGKSLAAEVLARELHLDLYRIDLSQVVSKYIGETEKNLNRVFDAADAGGAILLFDEADALFGKRSEVKDSHDRYANIEVSYLLQRMESYRGLAILTTNLKEALDGAFMRRIRFIVQFPFPDIAHRAEIWRRIFPAETPTDSLDADRLSRLHVSGGNIRNIALHAAFLAADGNDPVNMAHIRQAVKREYAKIEKPLSAAESETFSG